MNASYRLVVWAALAPAAATASANPTGATVVRGQVTVQQNGNLLQITHNPDAIVSRRCS